MSMRTGSQPGTAYSTKPRLLTRLILTLLLIFFAVMGTTFNGVIVMLDIQRFTLLLLGIMAGGWLILRQHRKLEWRRWPIAPVLLIWVAVFFISIIANPESWRRSAEALWFMGVYIGLLYLMLDVLSHGLRRATVVEAILITGLTTVLFGYLQLFTAAQEDGIINLVLSFAGDGAAKRPVSNIGNTNALGIFLVMLLPFIVTQVLHTRIRFVRIVMGFYALATLLLLLLTFSRGAWLGIGAGLITYFVLWLADRNLLSVKALRAEMKKLPSGLRFALMGGALMTVTGLVVVGAIFIASFSIGGRTTQLRTILWDAALTQFAEKPLTGQGLFTYGRKLGTFWSIPPEQPHSHSHNLPLHMLSETGLMGAFAMLISLVVFFMMMRHNWRHLKQERHLWLAAVAASVGFGVHHLFDTPSMMPLIALAGLLVLALAIATPDLPPVNAKPLQMMHVVVFASLWLVLLVAGFWQNSVHSEYQVILGDAYISEDYATGAQRMESVVASDPNQPAYVLQLGYLYGMAAADNDDPQPAIEAYSRYLELEPYDATAWSNLAGLYWQAGDVTQAQDAIAQARSLSGRWPHFKWQEDVYTGVLTEQEDVETPESIAMWGINRARFQYLRDIIPMEYLPQTGWGNPEVNGRG